jgi:hypothetical protein
MHARKHAHRLPRPYKIEARLGATHWFNRSLIAFLILTYFSKLPAAIPDRDTTTPADMATLVHKEVKGVEPPPPSIAIPEPSPGTSTSATPVYVEHEDVKPAVLHDGAESGTITSLCVQHMAYHWKQEICS